MLYIKWDLFSCSFYLAFLLVYASVCRSFFLNSSLSQKHRPLYYSICPHFFVWPLTQILKFLDFLQISNSFPPIHSFWESYSSTAGRPNSRVKSERGIQKERKRWKHPWSNRWETRAVSWDWSDKNSSTQAGRSVNYTQQEMREESRSVREEERQTRGNCVQYLV